MDSNNASMTPAEFRQQCVSFLDGVLAEIQAFGRAVNILDNEHLATLNIRQAEPLDIEEQAVDFGPRFFCPRFAVDEARQMTTDFIADHKNDGDDGSSCGSSIWPKRCRRGSYDEDLLWSSGEGPLDPEEPHPLCSPQTEALFRMSWFLTAMGAHGRRPTVPSPNLGVWEGGEWHYTP